MYTLLTLFCSGIFNWAYWFALLLGCHPGTKEEGVEATRHKNVPGFIYGLVTRLVSWDVELSFKKFLGFRIFLLLRT